MMANVDQFKGRLQAFKGETIPEEDIVRVAPFIENQVGCGCLCLHACLPFPPPTDASISSPSQDFTPENMTSKSAAAANLCTWVVNIYRFNRIYVKASNSWVWVCTCLSISRRSSPSLEPQTGQAPDGHAHSRAGRQGGGGRLTRGGQRQRRRCRGEAARAGGMCGYVINRLVEGSIWFSSSHRHPK